MLYSAVQQNIQVLFQFPNTDGTAGQVLQTDGYANLSFGTVGGGGKVLQVVNATDSTFRNTTSTSFVTGSNTLSVAITPSSTLSKIFVIVTVNLGQDSSTNKPCITIFRDATNLGNTNGMAFINSSSGDFLIPASISFLDSPSSTSSLTYQLYVKCSTGTAILNAFYPIASTLTSSITAFEIAG